MKYSYIFDFFPIQGYAWNDSCSGCFSIEADSEEVALKYGKRLAEYFVFSAWPEESWYDIYGRIHTGPEECNPEFQFRVGEVPQTADVERWLKGNGLTSSREHFNFVAGKPIRSRSATPDGSGLSHEDYLNHIWIPCGEIFVIREMNDQQKFQVVGLTVEENENLIFNGPDGGLLTLFVDQRYWENCSHEKLLSWYEQKWQPGFNRHIPKLRNWEFDNPVYDMVKMEQQLLRMDELFRAILYGGDSYTPTFRLWKMRGWGNGGPFYFPMLANSEKQKKRWTELLTPPTKVRNRFLAILHRFWDPADYQIEYFRDGLLSFFIMLFVFGVSFAIVYLVPEKLQWWIFTGFFSAVVICAFVFFRRKKRKKLMISIPMIREIFITNDDVLTPGDYCITITTSDGQSQTFIGSREVLRVAGYLGNAMPDASERIKQIVTRDQLSHGGIFIYKNGKYC